MFSYFKKGIKDVTQEKIIDINTLVRTIKNNPQVSKIKTIREMRANGKDYDRLKKSLPNITPAGIFSVRENKSFQQSSGYVYFDIDNIANNIDEEKQSLIDKYGHLISMVCISCSGKGLSILVKPEGVELNKDNYSEVRKYIAEEYFSELIFDELTKDVTRAWFISYDQDVYYTPEAFIEIRKSISPTIYNPTARLAQLIPSDKQDYDVKFLPINKVFEKLKFKTNVQVRNRIFDINPVEYCDVYFSPGYKIPTGQKQSIFITIIHKLLYLNPGVEPIYILSYLNFLNNTKTVKKAKCRDFIELFNMVYDGILETGQINPITRIKKIHFREKRIAPNEQRVISASLNGIMKQAYSIEVVQLAKQVLEAKGEKVLQKSVEVLIRERAEIVGVPHLSISTIKRYWNQDVIEIDKIVEELNESIQITYISKEQTSDNGVSDTQILDQNKNAA